MKLEKNLSQSCCLDCDEFKNKKCCGGFIYYPNDCDNFTSNGISILEEKAQLEAEMDADLEEQAQKYYEECCEANNPY